MIQWVLTAIIDRDSRSQLRVPSPVPHKKGFRWKSKPLFYCLMVLFSEIWEPHHLLPARPRGNAV